MDTPSETEFPRSVPYPCARCPIHRLSETEFPRTVPYAPIHRLSETEFPRTVPYALMRAERVFDKRGPTQEAPPIRRMERP
jgi:hypothetical protein